MRGATRIRLFYKWLRRSPRRGPNCVTSFMRRGYFKRGEGLGEGIREAKANIR
jgi:hypothetical protein